MGSTAGRSRVFVYRTAIKRLNGTSVTHAADACTDGEVCLEFKESVWPVRKMLIVMKDTDVIQTAAFAFTPLDDRICPPNSPVRCDNDDGSFFCISDNERCDGGVVCQVGEIECVDPQGNPFCHWGEECPPPGPKIYPDPGSSDECDATRPVSRCMETVCIHVIQTKVVHLVYVMSRLVTALIRVVRV